MIIVSRPINAITLNPPEYLLEGEKPKQFKSNSEAIDYLLSKGHTLKEIDFFDFEDDNEPPEIEPDYKAGYNILMDYWDSLPDEAKEYIDLRLKEVGL